MKALTLLERIERLFSWSRQADIIIKEHTRQIQDSLAESALAREQTKQVVDCIDDSIRCDLEDIKYKLSTIKET